MMVPPLRRCILITIAMGLTNVAMYALILAEASLRDEYPFLTIVTPLLIWLVALPVLAFLAVRLLSTVRRLARAEPPRPEGRLMTDDGSVPLVLDEDNLAWFVLNGHDTPERISAYINAQIGQIRTIEFFTESLKSSVMGQVEDIAAIATATPGHTAIDYNQFLRRLLARCMTAYLGTDTHEGLTSTLAADIVFDCSDAGVVVDPATLTAVLDEAGSNGDDIDTSREHIAARLLAIRYLTRRRQVALQLKSLVLASLSEEEN